MRRGISELFFVRAYKGRIVVKTAHLRGFYDRRPFIYQRTREEQTFTCNVVVDRVPGLIFELSHHMIFAEKKLLRESVNREIFGQITVDIFQKLFNLRIRRIRSAVRDGAGLQKNTVDINHKLRKKSIAEYFITKVLIFYGIFKFTQKITDVPGQQSLRGRG